MKINTNSWHYKLYRLTYTVQDIYPPKQTSLCQYFWRAIVLSLPIILGCSALILLAMLASLLLGSYPIRRRQGDFGLGSWDLKAMNLPKIGNVSLAPWMVLVPVLFLFLNVQASIHSWLPFWILELSLAITGFFMFSIYLFEKRRWNDRNKPIHKMDNVLISWIAAKKDKACPLIEFQDDVSEKEETV